MKKERNGDIYRLLIIMIIIIITVPLFFNIILWSIENPDENKKSKIKEKIEIEKPLLNNTLKT